MVVRLKHMTFLYCLLLAVGLAAFAQVFAYTFCKRWYKNNPESEKSNQFELLETVFKHRYARLIYIIVGVVCFIAATVLIAKRSGVL